MRPADRVLLRVRTPRAPITISVPEREVVERSALQAESLVGASPTRNASLLSRCKSCASLRAKERGRGANPRESALIYDFGFTIDGLVVRKS